MLLGKIYYAGLFNPYPIVYTAFTLHLLFLRD